MAKDFLNNLVFSLPFFDHIPCFGPSMDLGMAKFSRLPIQKDLMNFGARDYSSHVMFLNSELSTLNYLLRRAYIAARRSA